MPSIFSIFKKVYKQRFGEIKKSFQKHRAMKYRGIIALLLLSMISTFFVFAQVQASRATNDSIETPTVSIKESKTPTTTKKIITPTRTLSTTPAVPSLSPTITLTPTIQNAATVTPTVTKIPTPTKVVNRSSRFTPTPTKKVTFIPSPTFVPTLPPPTYTPFPTATTAPVQSISENTPFSFSLSPQGSFTPNARGEGSGTFTKPSGFWSFTFSGSFTKLMPNREYQLWLCGANCSSHTALRFSTNGEGNGGFSSANITHNQAKDPINRIVVWEASVPGIIHEDENSCVMVSMNHTPCLHTQYFLQ